MGEAAQGCQRFDVPKTQERNIGIFGSTETHGPCSGHGSTVYGHGTQEACQVPLLVKECQKYQTVPILPRLKFKLAGAFEGVHLRCSQKGTNPAIKDEQIHSCPTYEKNEKGEQLLKG